MARSLGFHNLLVPIAQNEESERAMDVACRLAADRGATIAVLRVIEVPPVLPLDAHMTEEDAAARGLLRRAGAIADSYGVHAVPRVVHGRDAARAIVQESEERSTELVVIGAPKRRRAAVGPTVAHVLKHAACRVLVISAAPEALDLVTDAAA